MRYELMRLLQLVFSLTLMFGAFAAGLAVGWYRWARRPAEGDATVEADEGFADGPARVLFSPDVDLRDVVPPRVTFTPAALPPPFVPIAAPQEDAPR